MDIHPTLYSFRRCPYAMRARLALASAQVAVELREVVLRSKPAAFLEASPSQTVPCLVMPQNVIDESLDIMKWALQKSDPEGWLNMPNEGWGWITRIDGPFKDALDRTKYTTRYPDTDPIQQRAIASDILNDLEHQMNDWIFKEATVADYAILPFVRQFAFIDKNWFDVQPWPKIQTWLERFINSERFKEIMYKYDAWEDGGVPIYFP